MLHFLVYIASELNYSDKGSRFFDRDYGPSNSLFHFFAQRSSRSSPARTCDQDCLSPPMMHLDVGEVGRTLSMHRPLIYPARDMQQLSHLKGLRLLGRMIAPEVLEIWYRSPSPSARRE